MHRPNLEFEKIEGYVWCDKYGLIHWYGMYCEPEEGCHEPIYRCVKEPFEHHLHQA